VQLKPREEWRKIPQEVGTHHAPNCEETLRPSAGRTDYRLEELIAEFDKAMQMPGWTNAWTMPIKTRIDMLSTGIRTPIGVKFSELVSMKSNGSSGAREIAVEICPVPGRFTRSQHRRFFIDIIPDARR